MQATVSDELEYLSCQQHKHIWIVDCQPWPIHASDIVSSGPRPTRGKEKQGPMPECPILHNAPCLKCKASNLVEYIFQNSHPWPLFFCLSSPGSFLGDKMTDQPKSRTDRKVKTLLRVSFLSVWAITWNRHVWEVLADGGWMVKYISWEKTKKFCFFCQNLFEIFETYLLNIIEIYFGK